MAKKVAKKIARKSAKKAAKKAAGPRADDAPPSALPRHPPPIDLDQLLGQPRAVQILRDAVTSERVHHAWIFHGPAGVGKATAALAFAALLLDPTTAPDLAGVPRPAEGSETQRRLRAAAHPDLHVITKALSAHCSDDRIRRQKQTTIPKAVVEEFLIEPAARTSLASAGAPASKVFVVDEADRLAPVGQNTLLKTLEEPPPGTVIILVTTNEERLLPTIRSRCQRVAFTPLDEGDMRRWLDHAPAPPGSSDDDDHALIAERPLLASTLTPAQQNWLLAFAAGAPGQVIAALKVGLPSWGERLEPMLTAAEREGFHPDLGPTMRDLVNALAAEVVDADARASRDIANREAADQMFRLLAARYSARLRAQVAVPPDPDAPPPALAAIDAIHAAQRRLASNVQLAFVMDELAARIGRAFRPPALAR